MSAKRTSSICRSRATGMILLVGFLLLSATDVLGQLKVPAAYRKGQIRSLPKGKPGNLDISDRKRLQFEWEKGEWNVLLSDIETIYVLLSRRSAWVEMGAYGAVQALVKRRKLLLSLQVSINGDRRTCVFFLPYGASREFVGALKEHSGAALIYESVEARKAVEEEP